MIREIRRSKNTDKIIFDLLVYKLSVNPRPGVLGYICRKFHLKYGYINSLTDDEVIFLESLAETFGLY